MFDSDTKHHLLKKQPPTEGSDSQQSITYATNGAKPTMDNTFDMKRIEKEIYAVQQAATNFSQQHTQEDDSTMGALSPPIIDEEDPFNKFWGVIGPMMEKLPVTDETIRPIDYDTTENDVETRRIEREMAAITDCFFESSNQQRQRQLPEDSMVDEPDSLKQKSPKKENDYLKEQISIVQKRIEELEKKSIDSTALKSSIIQFKNDVQKQALRILQENQETAAMMMTRSATATSPTHNIRNIRYHNGSINTAATSTIGGGASTAEIVNRIKELEEANRLLKSQNKKQDALMAKYKERWEKLKEGARKRQPQQQHSHTTA